MFPLDIVVQTEFHVISKVVKAVFVIRPIGDIRRVCLPSIVIIHAMLDNPHGHSQIAIDSAHPIGVSFRQIIVYRHQMNPFSSQRV